MGLSAFPASDPGHVARQPVRTCVGCRGKGEQGTLLRVVAVEDGAGSGWHLVPDFRRRHGGRGAYVHRDRACAELALQRRAFERALKHQGLVGGQRLLDCFGDS